MTQPFYHRVDGLLFTSTTGFSEEEFIELFTKFAKNESKKLHILPETIEIEYGGYLEPEAGDPCDLL